MLRLRQVRRRELAMPIYMGVFEKPNVLDKSFIGGAKTKGFEGWIELQSAQVGTTRSGTNATGRGSGREGSQPGVQDIVITKYQDAVSAALFREASSGTGRLIVIAFAKADGAAYMKIVLQDTIISSYSVSGQGGDSHAKPLESLSLNFTKVTYETLPKSPETTHSQMYQLSQQSSWQSYP
jgi:type VI secretion system secreted protein Hcp